ncbi:phage tail sheath family protein [Chakrabartyella piscis]|uniref:phage tail sheath family protein n=1 Tax=Chakrabartyella piscis TaxID=2918914 RepID=UPI00295880E6|nr:phage tail sheath family protein [Chakrabartyella piscis]
MALGGGTYLVQNKVLPGTYINFVSKATAMGSLGERGTLCIGMEMDWGSDEMMTIESSEFETGVKAVLGYDYLDDAMLPYREMFAGASTLKLFRLNGGTKASVTLEDLVATALYGGARGNDLQVAVSENVDEDDYFDIHTYLDGVLVDTQTVATISELTDNDYVTFSGDGDLVVAAAANLTGGTTTDTTGSGYTNFLAAAEAEEFQVLAYAGDDDTTKKLFVNFTKRLRDEEGIKFVTVLYDYTDADYEGIISVSPSADLVYWVAGMSAGAEVNESLTNTAYTGEYVVDCKDTKSNYTKRLEAGEFVFYADGDDMRVLRDINTFTSYESTKNSDFSSNRVIRVLDSIGNDVARIFSSYYLGKQTNNANGRNLLKAELIAYHEQLQSIEAIEDFTADDITVEAGDEKQDVVIYETVQPTDAMEKLYMRVEVV